jgi:predicted metal-dependent hydrolase
MAIYTAKTGYQIKVQRGSISLHWVIIMAPHDIANYVVVHELSHMIHHNHSPAFWQQVEKVLPNYRECRDWLKHHGQELKV